MVPGRDTMVGEADDTMAACTDTGDAWGEQVAERDPSARVIITADANAAGQYIELDAILAVVLGGTSLMGGKFSIAGTVIGVFTIQTLKSTITFLGVPPAVSPLFLAMVVVIVVLVQSQRVRAGTARLWAALTSRKNAEVAR